MKQRSSESKPTWQKTPVPNLVRYVPSGILFARVRVRGKLIRRSLKTKGLSVGKLRLTDFEKNERQMAEHGAAFTDGKMSLTDALAIYRQRLQGDAWLKPRTKAQFALLPSEIQELAKKNYRLWQQNPRHPSLQFKTVQDSSRRSGATGLFASENIIGPWDA